MPRLLIVSNRLPVTVHLEHGEVSVVRSGGGLATAMRSPHGRMESLWIGWPGDLSRLTPAQRDAVDAELQALRTVPVPLLPSEVHRFYDGFSNGVLWPLFHYLLDKVNLDARSDWEAYRDVNERFADVVAAHARPGDLIWIHDYQLALVPSLLRRRLPEAVIGFFLHIPFPAADVLRILPWREQILRGLLGADHVGFHTAAYRANFVRSAAQVLSVETEIDAIVHEERRIELGVHPIGIDVEAYARLAADPDIRADAQRIRAEAQGRKIVLGIDRLDYTKGIPRRLLAVERLLEHEPALRTQMRLIQIAVPTRERTPAYADFRRVVNELVGRINGHYGSTDAVPIHYIYRSFTEAQVAALYLAADVMLVTPLRDGMNLVAKEYVATRKDETGVLVLSEFAGAAAELAEALLVNPYDIDSVAAAVKQSLTMGLAEQQLRMRTLRGRVAASDVHLWARGFLDDLERAGRAPPALRALPLPPALPDELAASVQRSPSSVLILDYDGTLVPIASTPDLALVDDDLRALFVRLTQREELAIHIVSGRGRADLESRFDGLRVSLHAEHGFWSRSPRADAWTPLDTASTEWKAQVRQILDDVTKRCAGSFVEEKTVSIAWHYRLADPEVSLLRLPETRAALADLVRPGEIELLMGSKVLEIRRRGVHKGRVVPTILADAPAHSAVVAIGDDRTDEDLFAA
ncbi:MAG: bifunctional alpha,alpha-trehalose-phosphate synthase (UDP-forming)/trehalose-phosphatase, partial [Byssovorax sp.]